MKDKKYKLVDRGNKTLLKEGNKIVGYVAPIENGYSYNIGKPSDASVATFTSADPHGFTSLEAKVRLMETFIHE